MKNIQVSDEIYESLMILAKEFSNQEKENETPFFWQVQTSENIYFDSPDENTKILYVNGEGHELISDSDIYKKLSRHFIHFKESDMGDYSWERILGMLHSLGYHLKHYKPRFDYHNVFLTEDGVKEHIRQNIDNYSNPTPYKQYAYRNPEMGVIGRFLNGVGVGSKEPVTIQTFKENTPYKLTGRRVVGVGLNEKREEKAELRNGNWYLLGTDKRLGNFMIEDIIEI